jgi:hypothetical protein
VDRGTPGGKVVSSGDPDQRRLPLTRVRCGIRVIGPLLRYLRLCVIGRLIGDSDLRTLDICFFTQVGRFA